MSKPTINDMRLFILEKYPGMRWRERVFKMKPQQVAAVYRNIKNKEALENKVKDSGAIFMPQTDEYHQIDMFEYMLTMKGE